MGNQLTTARGTLLLWVFVLSGFSGLVYQSIWTQYLGLFLGHSSYAQSLVLILFMGGMALGAWWASRWSEKLARPLLAYAVIELVIGLLGLTFDRIYVSGTAFAYEQVFPALGNAEAVSVVRWVMSILLVLPACILLGATFPLMSAGFLRLYPAAGGRVLAGLYFSNSIGAAAGALAAAYLLLPGVGLPGTVMTAGLINILVAIFIYPLSKHESPAVRLESIEGGGAGLRFILLIAAATGATSFIYEIVWIRMLSLAVGTTLHAFELMLAAFISGIAFGGLWLRKRADRLRSPLLAVGWVQIMMGAAALLSLFVYANAFEWVGWLMRVLTRTTEGYTTYNIATAIIALLVMFPAAFFAGMTLPLLTLVLLRNGGGERAIGRTYAANTLGAIVGVLLAVHVLMPLLGVKWALWLAAAVDLLLGLVLLVKAGAVDALRAARWRLPGAIAGSFACLILALFVNFDPLVLASSVYRTGATSLGRDSEIHYYKDGKTASVVVYESGRPDNRSFSIATNGKVDAGLSKAADAPPRSDEYTMTLLPALPLAIKRDVSDIGVIGFGSGMTTHTLLGSSRVKKVDTVEIEPAMIEGARIFKGRVHRAFDDPRSNVIIDDAKAYFSSSRKRYDVIISEPSNPWMGGTASLFTEQFYDFVPRHLKDDGIFVQWLQLYEIDMPLVASVMRAILPRFKDVNAYLSNDGDLILVASPHGKVPRVADYLVGDSGLRAELRRIGIESPRDIEDGFSLDMTGLKALVSLYDVPANSDFYPYLQLNAPKSRFVRSSVSLFGDVATAPWPLSSQLGGYELRAKEEGLPETTREIMIDRKLRAARELRLAMVSGQPVVGSFAQKPDVIQMDALRGLAGACLLDQAPAQTSEMVFSLAMETVAYLRPQDLEGFWVNPAWLKCKPEHPLVVGALDFVSAASRGEHPEVIRLGQQLLDGENSGAIFNSGTSSYYVRGAMQFSALAAGRADIAKHLSNRYDDQLKPVVRQLEVLRLLNVISSAEVPGAN